MKTLQHIVKAYKRGWAALKLYKMVILLVYSLNLLLAFVAVGPLSDLLSSVIGHTTLGALIENNFDFTVVTEIMRHSDVGLEISINILSSFVILYLPWSVFYQGGFLALARTYPEKVSLVEFWSGGAIYFFRFMRLATYCMLIMAAAGFLAYKLMQIGSFNPLQWESELKVISTFKILVGGIFLIFFLVATFRDAAKIFIADNNSEFILKVNIQAFKFLLSGKIILLAALNITVLALVTITYAVLRKFIGSALIPAIILGQMFLIFRMMYSFVRISSFYNYCNNKTL